MELTQDNIRKLNQLIAKPASVSAEDMRLLSAVSERYPYFQPIYLLLAKASAETGNQTPFAKAAIYNSGSLLHQLIHRPEVFKSTDDFNVLSFEPKSKESVKVVVEAELDEFVSTEVSEPQIIEPVLKTEHHTFKSIETVEQDFIEEENTNPIGIAVEETNKEIQQADADEQTVTDSNEDVLEAESLAASDFFAFENTIADTITEVKEPDVEEYNQTAEDENVISKYDDDNLPYTFLWWLAKTRKEHEQIFRPYTNAKPKSQPSPTVAPGQLQHQYVEHIFHIQTPFNEADIATSTAIEPVIHKGDEIIEKFILSDPHIRALKANQIDNENKAKRSSEDNYDLVSETLAEVYIEQMLYHKAIDTYQKLSLKFPEKSSYFADLVQSLEKKI